MHAMTAPERALVINELAQAADQLIELARSPDEHAISQSGGRQ